MEGVAQAVVRRNFFEHDGSPAAQAALTPWLHFTGQHLGPVRAEHRVGTDMVFNARVSALCTGIAFLLLSPPGVIALGQASGWGQDMGALVVVSGLMLLTFLLMGLFCMGVYLAVIRMSASDLRIRVHAHGLFVHSATHWRAVPFATMDPGRLTWVTSPWSGRHVDTLRHRRLQIGRDGLLLSGTDGPVLDDPTRVGTLTDPTPHGPQVHTPFVWWDLGPKDPQQFLRDLEAAMVEDGYPAHGLAQWVHTHRVHLPYRRTTTDRLPPRMPGDPLRWQPRW